MTDVTQAAVESPEPAPYEFPAGVYDMAAEIAQDAHARLSSLSVAGFILGTVRIVVENLADDTEIDVDDDGDYVVMSDEGEVLATNLPEDEGNAETAETFVDVIEGYEADGDTDKGITAAT